MSTPLGPPVAAAADAAPRRTRRRAALVVTGLVAIVAGAGLWALAGSRYDDAVADLAPAPVGCETTLEFDGRGTYLFFVETRGELGDLAGDCAGDRREYDYDGDALPRVSLTLVDPDGDQIDLDRVGAPSYDRAGRSGTAVRTARIEAAGTYVLTVDANDADIVVRVGKDPRRGVAALRAAGVAAVLGGVAVVVVGLVLGRRSRPSAPAGALGLPSWTPSGGPPPVAPPYAHRPGSPPYAPGSAPGPSWAAPGAPPAAPPRRPLPPPPPPRR